LDFFFFKTHRRCLNSFVKLHEIFTWHAAKHRAPKFQGERKKTTIVVKCFALPVWSETKPEYAIYGVTFYSWAFIKWGQKFELMCVDVDHVLIHLTTEVGNKGHKRVIFSRVGGVMIQVSSLQIQSHAYLLYRYFLKYFFYKYTKIIFFYFINFIFNINPSKQLKNI
jgi:hypothetical protein